MVWRQRVTWSKWEKTLWNTNYWSRELVLSAESVGAGKNAANQRLLALIRKPRRCSTIGSYAEKGRELSQQRICMLKLGCMLPIMTKKYLHNSSSAKNYPCTKIDRDFLLKVLEDNFWGLWIVFTRKAVVGETHICKSTNICISILGLIAS